MNPDSSTAPSVALTPISLAHAVDGPPKTTIKVADEDVETGNTGHAESVRVTYDPAGISYERLLDIYWHHIDPLTLNSAFCDYGPQYRSVIFYHDAEQPLGKIVEADAKFRVVH